MGWEDRPYYRDRPSSGGNPFMWLMTGSVPLFTAFGIRVRAHAGLIVLIVLVLLLGLGQGSTVQDRVQSMSILFIIILLHEFGHCFAARWTGGQADEIVMTPLGGLAMTMARRQPWPTFVTVAGGPLVNVVICIVCGIGIYLLSGDVLLTPNAFVRNRPTEGWLDVFSYLYWFYLVSYALLIFNMLPVYPLDGGQMLQSILWRPMGYYKSMVLTMNLGLVGAALMFMVGVATLGTAGGGFLLIFIAIMCSMNCYQIRNMLRVEGPWAFSNEDAPDYGGAASYTATRVRPSRTQQRLKNRARKAADEEAAERVKIDAILAKVSQHGMHSLTWIEKRTLKQATERQRKREKKY